MDTIKLRQEFLNYFRHQKHKFMPPSKVSINDPTLLFVNAGMNQLKDVFLGERDTKYDMLMNYQICIRAGGKHNDFDDVGKDSYHLTSFEMLGNWSIDNYKKEEAIRLAYTFLVDIIKLDKDRIYVTYFEGGDGLQEDTETKNIWKSFVPSDKILKGSYEDNFWMMADEGPCGGCTEIHYDLLGDRDASTLVNKDDPTVIEIWNLVFMEYNKVKDKYIKLDKFYVDTGMGLERLSMVVNNKPTIYQTDAFRYLIGYAQAMSGGDMFRDSYDGNMVDISYRIFADHMRTVVNALFDGIEFHHSGNGSVLRKIFRRCLTHLYVFLNRKKAEPMMSKLIVKALISDILNYFLKNKHDVEQIQNSLINEEKMYLGKLFSCKKRYKKLSKKNNSHKDIKEKLKTEFGINNEIVDNINDMVFIK
jgi:alanyl-tRNA synthetase